MWTHAWAPSLFISHENLLVGLSQLLSVLAVILPVAASLRTASHLCLRSAVSQQKVCLVVGWFTQKHGRPWSSWQQSPTSQPNRGTQDRGFTSWRQGEGQTFYCMSLFTGHVLPECVPVSWPTCWAAYSCRVSGSVLAMTHQNCCQVFGSSP